MKPLHGYGIGIRMADLETLIPSTSWFPSATLDVVAVECSIAAFCSDWGSYLSSAAIRPGRLADPAAQLDQRPEEGSAILSPQL